MRASDAQVMNRLGATGVLTGSAALFLAAANWSRDPRLGLAQATVVLWELAIPRMLATTGAAEGGALLHFTSTGGAAAIRASGQIVGRGGIFALPVGAASRGPVAHAALTGLSPAKTAQSIKIAGAGRRAFHRVIPAGPYSLLKALGGVRFSAPGTMTWQPVPLRRRAR